ncbi:hypothetical protein B0H13DRAFT_2272136 [Mycena leptocephala]|nr:hypothetical protein B0H13DRAFT_2272136 [Mycena leptocephala]
MKRAEIAGTDQSTDVPVVSDEFIQTERGLQHSPGTFARESPAISSQPSDGRTPTRPGAPNSDRVVLQQLQDLQEQVQQLVEEQSPPSIPFSILTVYSSTSSHLAVVTVCGHGQIIPFTYTEGKVKVGPGACLILSNGLQYVASKGIKGVSKGGKGRQGAAMGVKRTARGRQEGAGWGLFSLYWMSKEGNAKEKSKKERGEERRKGGFRSKSFVPTLETNTRFGNEFAQDSVFWVHHVSAGKHRAKPAIMGQFSAHMVDQCVPERDVYE